MLSIRIGATWKEDPALRAVVARGRSAVQDALAHAVDAVAVEVDGIDLCAGLAEGAVVASVESLAQGLLAVLGGAPRAHVHFAEGGIELVVARRGASAFLTAVSLRRPARVLARDVEVELAALVHATTDAARALAAELDALHAETAFAARSIRALATRLEAARPGPEPPPPHVPPGPVARPRRDATAPSCAFELHDDAGLLASYQAPGADLGSLLAPGRVVLRDTDGRDIVTAEGPPFLVLRDLVTFAGAIAAATRSGGTAATSIARRGRSAAVELEADLASGTLVRDGARCFPCPPLALARAICDAAGDLVGVIVARNPWQERNGWVAELRNDAAERRAQLAEILAGDVVASDAPAVRHRRRRPLPAAPLGPGRMRRIVFRRAWTADVGAPLALALARRHQQIVAAGRAAVLAADPSSGRVQWRRAGVTAAWLRDETIFLADDERLVCADPATGADRWSIAIDALPHRSVRDVRRISGGGAVAAAPGAVVAVDGVRGSVAWSFAPPAALEVRAAAVGSLVLAASDAGFVYGLDAQTGRQRWRLHLPGPVSAPPLMHGGAWLLVCTTDLGGSLLSVDPATGRRGFEVPLDVTPTGTPVPFAGLLAIAGTVAGDSVVTAIDPDGRLAWEDAPPLGAGPLALAPLRSGLLAKTADGGCAALGRAGETLWSRAASSAHPPPANVAPILARSVALVPSEHVAALDAETGTFLGSAPIAAPVRLVCGPALDAWGLDADGVLTAARVETHLGVL